MSIGEQYWEPYYAHGRSRWSGRPNASLVQELDALAPGRALDLGSGQGGDAIWLASIGWTVTAVDVSASALAVAERNAAAAGVADAIAWERHDLATSFPDGSFDLVAATFLHSPVELPRGTILRTAAAAVAPGGSLVVIGHLPSPAHQDIPFPTAAEVVAELDLPRDGWRVVTAEERTVRHAFAGEEPVERVDGVVRVVRRGER
jgi:2-polyprenyl-3-methyl-5-hydroxy-6-metoxy-1,4-benzoquinol methylase